MIAFDAPFVPDADYVDFLAQNADRLFSVHFSLNDPAIPDARVKNEATGLLEMIERLQGLPGVRKYALLNSRFHPADYYAGGERLRALAVKLHRLRDADVLDGVVFADQYLIQALSDHFPETAERLEAVPSVNAAIDCFERASSALRYLEFTRFRQPRKLILDRSLNRNAARLSRTSARIREAYPGMAIVLLANEGCLRECPFKAAHESLIALAAGGFGRDATFGVNADKGCVRYFFNDPSLIFRSPFIRPEDGERYAGSADALKLCGRTRGAATLRKIVAAYLEGSFRGNLLELMDTMECLSERLYVANHELPGDFADQTNGCARVCKVCGYCAGLAADHVRKLPVALGRAAGTDRGA